MTTRTSTSPTASPPKRRFWRFQFRLATLLVLVTVISIWLGLHTESARKQRHTVAELQSLGATITYDYQARGKPSYAPEWLRRSLGDDFFSNVVHVEMEGRKFTDEMLQPLAGLGQLKSVWIQETSITDAGLARLGSLATVEDLSLAGDDVRGDGFAELINLGRIRLLNLNQSSFTDEGMEYVTAWMGLEELHLAGTKISDKGTRNLSRLKSLKDLNFGGTSIGDETLEAIRGCTNLERLYLQRTHVSDDGLRHLSGLTKLKTLYLDSIAITDAGLVPLRGLANLQLLCVRDNMGITDAGLVNFVGLDNLAELNLSSTAISDAGLATLAQMTNLKTLKLDWIDATPEAVETLRGKLSTTSIVYSPRPPATSTVGEN